MSLQNSGEEQAAGSSDGSGGLCCARSRNGRKRVSTRVLRRTRELGRRLLQAPEEPDTLFGTNADGEPLIWPADSESEEFIQWRRRRAFEITRSLRSRKSQ